MPEPQPEPRDGCESTVIGCGIPRAVGARSCCRVQDKSHREEQCHSTLRVELRDVEGACQEILFAAMLARS